MKTSISYEVVTKTISAQPLHSWRAATGRAFGGYSWEIYGDWTDDETKLDTEVIHLLS
jgi:hypothetical protein